jgi:hypothetical protein
MPNKFTPQERRAMIEKVRALPAQLEATVRGLTNEQLTTHYLANEWTVAQNVHHVADSHMNSFIRTKLILTEVRPTLKPYNQDLWAVRADADHTALELSLQLLKGLHARWVMLFESLGEDEWLRTGMHPEIGEVTLEDQLRIYSAHGEGHIAQINKTLAAQP